MTAIADTSYGRVRGEAVGDVRVWRSIRYAKAPVGESRFRAPQPPDSWPGIRSATEARPVAWQSEAVNPFTGQPVVQHRDEDCLVVNVTAPVEPPPDEAGYPVLVWVHGGGYVQGAGADDLVGDAAVLARRGLVVVTFNYRLGALGFLHLADVAGPELADAGQAGFLDQVTALRWVRDNIAGFGGDPRRVTIYGVSAGAKSVANLIASPLSAGLISRAISSSGGAEHVATPQQAIRVRRRLLRELGLADDAAGVRQLIDVPPAELVAAQEAIATGAQGTWVWRPVLGGTGIPVLPIDAVGSGSGAGIPLLIGHNGAEGASYQLMDASSAGQAPRVLAELFGVPAAAEMLAAYSAARPELDEAGISVAVLSAERYGVPTHRLALAQAAHAPVWRYRYDGCPPGIPADLAGGHGLDMLAVWGADSFTAPARSEAPQARLAQAMAAAWAAFARGESPVASLWDGRPLAWDNFGARDESTLVLSDDPHLEQHPRRAEFDIWAGKTWISGTWWDLGL
jgi:para-nitrobenzyl esterase